MSNYLSNFYHGGGSVLPSSVIIGQQHQQSISGFCKTTFLYGSGSKNLSLGIPMEEIASGNGSVDHGGSIKRVLPTTCLIYKLRGEKPDKYDNYDEVYNRMDDEEFIEDISCGESASAFLTSKGRVFTSANSTYVNDALTGSQHPTFIFASYSDPRQNSNEGMIVELDLKRIAAEERQLLLDECLGESFFGVKQVCIMSTQLCIVSKNGFIWMLDNTDTWKLVKCYRKDKSNEFARIKYVTSGLSHLVALSDNGEIFSVGLYDNYGACGCGIIVSSTETLVHRPIVPLKEGDSILDVYAGYYRTLLVSKFGKLYVCGWGVYNQQGIGHAENITSFVLHEPMAKTGEQIIKVALGALHTICLCESGNIYAMGFNSYGQCGDDTDNHPFPIAVKVPMKIKDVFCGWHFTILQSMDGEFYGAGANSSGELASISPDGANISRFKLLQLPKAPLDNSQLTWRIYTCSFSSNVFYMGRLALSKRNHWMQQNLKNLAKKEALISDIVILH